MLGDHLLKRKKEYENLKKQEIWDIFIKTMCSQYDMIYGGFKDLPRRTSSDKVLFNKALNIAKYQNMIKRGIASIVYNCFFKKSATCKGTGINLM